MEGTKKQPMTESTRNELDKLIDDNFSISTLDLDKMRANIEKVEKFISTVESDEKYLADKSIIKHKDETKQLLRLQEFVLLTQLVWLDIVCAFRVYLNAKYEYESVFSAKLLVITVNEGSKKIFHFEKHRKSSFWGKDIREFMLSFSPTKSSQYFEIELQIERLDSLYKDFGWQAKRKILVHYDDNPSRMYDLLENLDIETVSKNTIPFIKTLYDMKVFSYELSNDFFLSRI